MRRILDEIQDGRFAAEWIAENRNGRPRFNALRAAGASTRSRRSAPSCGR
jgi:ketol-acid reductoisomerase